MPDSQGQTGRETYPYVSGGKLLSVIRPIMDEVGLILLQEVVDIDNQRQDYSTKNGPKTSMFTSVRMKFTWVDAETGEKVEELFCANGMNDWDKGLGSALTYGERYFLMKTFHISTNEDDVDAIVRPESMSVLPRISQKQMQQLAQRMVGKNQKEVDELVEQAKQNFTITDEDWYSIYYGNQPQS